MSDDRTPTLAEADAERAASEQRYAEARRLIDEGRTKAAEAAVESAIEHEREADRLELLARRALMAKAQP